MAESKNGNMRHEYILYALIWVVIAMLPIFLELWEYMDGAEFEWRPVLRWWTGMVPLVAIFLLHNHLLIPRLLKKGKIKHYCVSVSVILLAFGTMFFSMDRHRPEMHGERRMPPPHHIESPHARPPMPMHAPVLPLPVLFKFVLALLTLGVNVAISLSFSYSREQANRKDLENYRLQEELKYLKQQISPHFFMNVLNNIHEMAEDDVAKAQEMILELSRLMRYVLYESENPVTTLASEVRFISSYVDLMRMRYLEDVVKINLELPEDTSGYINIPPLLFISFIENAFKHGVSYLSDTVIDIRLHEKDGKVLFSCSNTVPSRNPETSRKGGVGLVNVRRRLDLLYGEDYSLKINEDDKLYSVTLIIPSL